LEIAGCINLTLQQRRATGSLHRVTNNGHNLPQPGAGSR